jgi:hypothetical protein
MIYFYLWALVLVIIALAVPVASFLEKRRNKIAAGPVETVEPNIDTVEGGEDASSEAPVADDGIGEFGESVPAGADDFSAFEDFK